MTATTALLPQITRTQNKNGTYRFVVDGTVHTKGSTKAYTHASVYLDQDARRIVLLHTRHDLAVKGSADWNRFNREGIGSRVPGVVTIDLADQATELVQTEDAPYTGDMNTSPTPTKESTVTATKKTTVQIKNAPIGALIHIHAVNGTTLPTPEKGSVHKTAGAALFSVRTATLKGVEFDPTTKITFHTDDADTCPKHNEGLRQRPGGIVFCPSCYREQQKAYRGRKREGIDGQAERKAKQAEAREARVQAASVTRERSREQMLGALFATASAATLRMKGSQARTQAYRAARLTAMAADHGITVEQAANLAGIAPWAPMTWKEYRQAFAKHTKDEQAA